MDDKLISSDINYDEIKNTWSRFRLFYKCNAGEWGENSITQALQTNDAEQCVCVCRRAYVRVCVGVFLWSLTLSLALLLVWRKF